MSPDGVAPVPDLDSAPFWAGLAEGHIVVQECPSCGRRRLPRMPACPWCAASGGIDVPSSGSGTVYSWVRVDRALTPAMAGDVPYCIATVDLDGGGRVHARLEPASAAAIGARVTARFVDRGGWTELRFSAGQGDGGS